MKSNMKKITLMLMVAITLSVSTNAGPIVDVNKVVRTSVPLEQSSAANQWLVKTSNQVGTSIAGSIQYLYDSLFRW